jgi:hypothetical protein
MVGFWFASIETFVVFDEMFYQPLKFIIIYNIPVCRIRRTNIGTKHLCQKWPLALTFFCRETCGLLESICEHCRENIEAIFRLSKKGREKHACGKAEGLTTCKTWNELHSVALRPDDDIHGYLRQRTFRKSKKCKKWKNQIFQK